MLLCLIGLVLYSREKITTAQTNFIAYQPPIQPPTEPLSQPRTQPQLRSSRLGSQLRHAHEELASTQARVQDLENILGLTERWVPGSEAWERAAALTDQRQFRKCVDELESLVVSRIFELMKMNMAGTGEFLLLHLPRLLRNSVM